MSSAAHLDSDTRHRHLVRSIVRDKQRGLVHGGALPALAPLAALIASQVARMAAQQAAMAAARSIGSAVARQAVSSGVKNVTKDLAMRAGKYAAKEGGKYLGKYVYEKGREYMEGSRHGAPQQAPVDPNILYSTAAGETAFRTPHGVQVSRTGAALEEYNRQQMERTAALRRGQPSGRGLGSVTRRTAGMRLLHEMGA